MPIRVALGREQLGRRFSAGIKRDRDRVLAALRQAAVQSAKLIEQQGRADIARAGRFSDHGGSGLQWLSGFHARVTEGGGFIRIGLSHDVPFWSVFQYGKTIHGRPLLWIPLSFARDAKYVRARDYPGRLFRVDRQGKSPLLLTTGGAPKYFGRAQVRLPKKFHLLEIAAQISRGMQDLYRRAFARNART
jgi:hypothetical protein